MNGTFSSFSNALLQLTTDARSARDQAVQKEPFEAHRFGDGKPFDFNDWPAVDATDQPDSCHRVT